MRLYSNGWGHFRGVILLVHTVAAAGVREDEFMRLHKSFKSLMLLRSAVLELDDIVFHLRLQSDESHMLGKKRIMAQIS